MVRDIGHCCKGYYVPLRQAIICCICAGLVLVETVVELDTNGANDVRHGVLSELVSLVGTDATSTFAIGSHGRGRE